MAIVKLDYDKAQLNMEKNTPLEESYRVVAAAKEPWTVRFIESIPTGGIFWDLGACVGSYSLIATSRGLNVVAIEPMFGNYATLCRNLAMNRFLDKALVLCLALGPDDGWVWMHLQDTRSGAGGHFIGASDRKQGFHKQLIQCRRWDTVLDWLPYSPDLPQYAKVDIEGGEMALIEGAGRVLQRLTALLIEFPLAVEADVTKALAARGFRLAERFDQRNGKPIVGVAYGRFERA